jgi:hypothetical protein
MPGNLIGLGQTASGEEPAATFFYGVYSTTGGSGVRLTASSSGLAAGPGSPVFAVSPFSTSAALQFVQQPATVAANTAMSTPITVKIQDAYGNDVTNDNSTQVTLSIQTGSGTITAASGPVTAVNGVATFNGVKLSAAGTYTLRATSALLASPSTVSNSFTVSP